MKSTKKKSKRRNQNDAHRSRNSGAIVPLAVSVEEAAARAGVGRSLAYRDIKAGRLRAIKMGRRTLVRVADIEAWLGNLPTINAAQ